MNLRTKYCVRCGKRASVWTGHVLRLDRRGVILAGWCKKCVYVPGFVGHHLFWMGQEEDK